MLTRCSLLLLGMITACGGVGGGCGTSMRSHADVAKATARADELSAATVTIESIAIRVERLALKLHEQNAAERSASRFAAVAANPRDASVRRQAEEQIRADVSIVHGIQGRAARVRTAAARVREAAKELRSAAAALAMPQQSNARADPRVGWRAAELALDAASTELHAAADALTSWTWQFQQ